jgi:hypothetical protein
MFNAIVSQPDEYRNFGFESLTSDERDEYAAWSDEVNIGTRDPLPSDFGIVPIDDEQVERDYHLLVEAGWIERPRLHRVRNGVSQLLYSRVNLHSQILRVDWTATPPRPVKHALNNGSDSFRWGQSFVYFKFDDDARAYRDAQPRGWEVR